MAVKAKQETLGFQTEVRQLLDLMIHSLYGNQDIFLRELISNASDAADKLRFESLQDDSLYENDSDLSIRVEYNPKNKTISVIDNSIGMSRAEVIEQLGTIAKSGTRQFFESLTGDQGKDSQLIGQFGVGFYSAFIVAEKVEVTTRRAGLSREQGVYWSSTGENDYTIKTVDRPKRGTRVVLHLRDNMHELLNGHRLRGIITKYSDHISMPVEMPAEGEDAKGHETVNSATALWTRNKKDISPEEYNQFYQHIAHDFEDPLAHVYNKVEGKLEYTSLLYIPARAPFDLWDRERQHGVKLYVRRVFIMDNAEQLLPSWLRFVKGVVDSDDLPLNISREILQQSKTIDSIRSGCAKKILGLLKDMAKNDADKYKKFWEIFGKVLKEGIIDSANHKQDITALLRFASTHRDSEDQETSLQDYVERMRKDQKAIYYITSGNYAMARHSPHLEFFHNKGIEVLLLTDPVDEWVVPHLNEYEGKPLASVTKGELNIDDLDNGAGDQKPKKDRDENKKLLQRIKEALDDQVKEVRLTHRLTHSPACLVSEENEMGRHLEQILKASGQTITGSKPILEINAEHPIISRLEKEADENSFSEWARIIFDQALLSEGGHLEDPTGFVSRLNRRIVELAGGQEKPEK